MAVSKKERHEFIDSMFDKIDNLPVESVVGRYVDLKRQGRHLLGLCPFHKDTKLGSFIVTPDKGMWKCFTCGADYSGNAVKFVALYKNEQYLEAAFNIARENGLITFDEYEKYSGQTYQTDYVNRLRKIHSQKKAVGTIPVKANANILHNVYQCMKNVSPLSEEHRKTLEVERKLSPKRIGEDYFTFPSRRVASVVREIQKKYPNYTDEVLKTVPGFYFDRKTGKVRFFSVRGIGILIRNADGFIEAVQIRRDVLKEGQSRYIWFSSTFALSDPDKYSGGCGCRSPKDVLYPSADAKKILCITEGRFKSEILAQNGNISVSLQGVTAWRGIEAVISDIQRTNEINKIFLFFDADIWGKHELFLQSVKLAELIGEKFPDLRFYYAVWRKKYGKGVDDCILAGHKDRIHYMNKELVINAADGAFETVLKRFGVTRLMDVPQEKAGEFQEMLQCVTEDILRL